MKIYTIPSDLSKDICIKDVSETCINDPFMKKISETKCKLDNNINLWDKAKKHINDYEYIYFNETLVYNTYFEDGHDIRSMLRVLFNSDFFKRSQFEKIKLIKPADLQYFSTALNAIMWRNFQVVKIL